MTSLKTLTLQKEKLQQQIASEEEAISSLKEKVFWQALMGLKKLKY